MFIHYDANTLRVTGYTTFIHPVPEVWDRPTIDVPGYDFEHSFQEYEVHDGAPVHMGRNELQEAAMEESKIDYIKSQVQKHLDTIAQSRGYESVLSACSYAGAVNPFEAEGKSFVAWRGDVWAYCYQVLADVQNLVRPEPTIPELIAELPVYTDLII